MEPIETNSQRQIVKLDGVKIDRVHYQADNDGWIELGYESGTLEFTIVQITFHGDWRIDTDDLKSLYDFAKRELEIGPR